MAGKRAAKGAPEPIAPLSVDMFSFTDVRRYLQEVMYEQVRLDHARGVRVHTQPWWSRGAWVSIGAVNALFAGIKVVRGRLRARRGDDDTPETIDRDAHGNEHVRRSFFPVDLPAEGPPDGKHFRMETLRAFARMIRMSADEAAYYALMLDAHCARHDELRHRALERLRAVQVSHAAVTKAARLGFFRSWVAQALPLFLELPDAPADADAVPDWFVARCRFSVSREAVAAAFAELRAGGALMSTPHGWRRRQVVSLVEARDVRSDKEQWDAYVEGLRQYSDLADVTFDDWDRLPSGAWRRKDVWNHESRFVTGLNVAVPVERFGEMRARIEALRDELLVLGGDAPADTVVRVNLQLFALTKPVAAHPAAPPTGGRPARRTKRP